MGGIEENPEDKEMCIGNESGICGYMKSFRPKGERDAHYARLLIESRELSGSWLTASLNRGNAKGTQICETPNH